MKSRNASQFQLLCILSAVLAFASCAKKGQETADTTKSNAVTQQSDTMKKAHSVNPLTAFTSLQSALTLIGTAEAIPASPDNDFRVTFKQQNPPIGGENDLYAVRLIHPQPGRRGYTLITPGAFQVIPHPIRDEEWLLLTYYSEDLGQTWHSFDRKDANGNDRTYSAFDNTGKATHTIVVTVVAN